MRTQGKAARGRGFQFLAGRINEVVLEVAGESYPATSSTVPQGYIFKIVININTVTLTLIRSEVARAWVGRAPGAYYAR